MTTERVQLYDGRGEPAGTAPRATMRTQNLCHGATAVVVLDPTGRIYVHRRTVTKDVHPGRYDFAAGGVLTAGEDPESAAARELEEELGIAGVALTPVRIARFTDDRTDYWGFCYHTVWDGPVHWQPDEVAWGDWWDVARLMRTLQTDPQIWMPDTVALLGSWVRARLRS